MSFRLVSFKAPVSRRVAGGAFVLLLTLGALAFPGFASGQQAAPTSSGAAAPSGNDSFITPQTAQDQNLAAADQEDEDAVYKKSPAVRAVGKFLHLSPEHASIAFEDFNFVVLAGVILFYAVKLLPKVFRGRQDKISQQLQEARSATEDANERLQVVEARLGRLDQEIAQLRTRAEQDGAADEQRIKASIEEERKKIVATTEHEIGALSAAAERSLRKFAAELAVARASARLHLTEADDRTLVRDFSASVSTELQGRRN